MRCASPRQYQELRDATSLILLINVEQGNKGQTDLNRSVNCLTRMVVIVDGKSKKAGKRRVTPTGLVSG